MAVGVYGGRLGLTSAEARTVYRQAQRIVRSVAFFVRRNARRKCDRRSFRAAGAVRLAGSPTLGALHDDRPVCASLRHEEEGCRDCRRCGRTSLFFSEFPDSVLQFLQSAAGERGLGEQPVELGPIQSEPLLGIHSLQFGHGTKSLVRGDRGPAVVRTGPLAQVAAENPSVQLAFVSFAAFDGPARDAAGSVDSPSGQNGSGRTRVDAAVAVSAAVGHGRPAGVELGRRNDPKRGWIRSEFRPIQPSPASAAHAFSTIGAVSVKARPSESGYSSRTRTSSSASFSRSVR